jgi:hypothetical protein
MTTPMVLTSRYQSKAIRPDIHATYRTTIGGPRFPLGYTLDGAMPAIQPPSWVFNQADEGEEVYTKAYRQHLDSRLMTGDEAKAYLQAFAARHPGKALVLLCFCDLSKPGTFCHRRIFAQWYEEKTGDSIPEL